MASGYTRFFTGFPVPPVLFEKPLFKWRREGEDKLHYTIRDGLDQRGRQYLGYHIKLQGFAAALHLDKMNLILQRPRILKFDDVDFGILENIELKIPAAEYEQPFETVVIELPEEYRKANTVTDPLFEKMDNTQSVIDAARKATMYPMFVSSTWRKDLKMLVLHIFLSSHDVYGCVIGGTEFDLEAQLVGCQNTFIKSLPILDEERVIYNRILRACLNASLFATTVQLESEPENPSHYERLKSAEGATTPNTDAWRRFKAHPFIYTSPSRVIEQAGNFTERGVGGWTVSPHWRKAHWRMQRCGVGLTETKRLLIAAVLVNGDKL